MQPQRLLPTETSVDALGRLSREPSVEYQLFQEEDRFAALNLSGRMAAFAVEPRRKASNGDSRRTIIARLASQPGHMTLRTKELWRLFLGHLDSLGLHPADADGVYTYDGQRARISVSYKNFENRVSELAPRRAGRKQKH